MKQSEDKNTLVSKIIHFMEPKTPSIVDAIKEDHDDLKKLIAVLKDPEMSLSKKNGAYLPFVSLLKSHTTAEEQVLYNACLKVKELSFMGQEGFVEHTVASELIQSISKTRKSEVWEAKVKVLAELVEHHIQEEEGDFLPQVDSTFSDDQKIMMMEEFVKIRSKTQVEGSKNYCGVLNAA